MENNNPQAERISDLPLELQNRAFIIGTEFANTTRRKTTSILISPPAGTPGQLHNSSGFVLSLRGAFYLGTAWHVLEHWKKRYSQGEDLIFQVGHFCLTPSDSRIAWKDQGNDVVFLCVTTKEVAKIGVDPCEPMYGWPPPRPVENDYLLLGGFPGQWRARASENDLIFGAIVTRSQITSVGETHVTCQFNREYWIPNGATEAVPSGLGGIVNSCG
jgi:hypothetical protein